MERARDRGNQNIGNSTLALETCINISYLAVKDFVNHQKLRFNIRKWLLLSQNLPKEDSIGVGVARF